MLIILCGLPGSGKSTLARALAGRSASAVLDKDTIREAIFGAAHTDYSRAQDDLCGAMMLSAAAYLLRKDPLLRVYIDGRVYSRAAQLRLAVEQAARLAVPWRILHCVCPEEEAHRRLQQPPQQTQQQRSLGSPAATGHPARNRNFELYRRLKASFEPIAFEHLTIDTSLPLEDCVAKAARYLGLSDQTR
ncbi:MAG: ATP-binding protein [Candidatus Korobacteraceae bacterium]|jgi:predicted kinase